ncbi:MAG TPA: hypothetical protein ENH82_07970 [bacterium]|nr:hypothetical protein [bacterium]
MMIDLKTVVGGDLHFHERMVARIKLGRDDLKGEDRIRALIILEEIGFLFGRFAGVLDKNAGNK